MPTIADIAAQAGVSASTVSKALHPQADRYRLRPALREQIRAVALELGWDPNPRRRAAARRRTHTVSLLFDQHQWFALGVWADVAELIAQALTAVDYRLAHAPVPNGLDAWKRGLQHHACDAVIAIDPLPHDRQRLPELGLPVVIFNERTEVPVPHVVPDEAQGMGLAVAHLQRLGHHHIALLRWGGTMDHWSVSARRDAFIAHTAAAGMRGDVRLVESRHAFVESLRHPGQPTAVITYCHVDAVLLLQTCWAAGVRIPHQLSVVTIDHTWYTQFTCPALTCVALPVASMAQLAVRLVVDSAVSGIPAEAREHALPCTLVLGASAAAPRAR